MPAAVALAAIIGMSLRQIRVMRRALTNLTSSGCDQSWCACELTDTPDCHSTIRVGGGWTCDKTAGHSGMHTAGGYCWTENFARDCG